MVKKSTYITSDYHDLKIGKAVPLENPHDTYVPYVVFVSIQQSLLLEYTYILRYIREFVLCLKVMHWMGHISVFNKMFPFQELISSVP